MKIDPPNIKIRKATIQDARHISYLIQKNTEKVVENQYSAAQKKAWKKANTPKVIQKSITTKTWFCAFSQQKLVGTIALEGKELSGLYVSYTKRGLGIGRLLMTYLETYAIEQGITELVLTSTPSALRFYENNGFVKLGPVSVDVFGVPFPEMAMKKEIGTQKI